RLRPAHLPRRAPGAARSQDLVRTRARAGRALRAGGVVGSHEKSAAARLRKLAGARGAETLARRTVQPAGRPHESAQRCEPGWMTEPGSAVISPRVANASESRPMGEFASHIGRGGGSTFDTRTRRRLSGGVLLLVAALGTGAL